eukprot:UN27791
MFKMKDGYSYDTKTVKHLLAVVIAARLNKKVAELKVLEDEFDKQLGKFVQYYAVDVEHPITFREVKENSLISKIIMQLSKCY